MLRSPAGVACLRVWTISTDVVMLLLGLKRAPRLSNVWRLAHLGILLSCEPMTSEHRCAYQSTHATIAAAARCQGRQWQYRHLETSRRVALPIALASQRFRIVQTVPLWRRITCSHPARSLAIAGPDLYMQYSSHEQTAYHAVASFNQCQMLSVGGDWAATQSYNDPRCGTRQVDLLSYEARLALLSSASLVHI